VEDHRVPVARILLSVGSIPKRYRSRSLRDERTRLTPQLKVVII